MGGHRGWGLGAVGSGASWVGVSLGVMTRFAASVEVVGTRHFNCTNCHRASHFTAVGVLFRGDHSLNLCPPRSEEANKAFSAAVQMHDVLVKAWAMWGDYLESIFVKERQLHLGVSAITCYLHACRHQNESKSRKYLAKVRPEALASARDLPGNLQLGWKLSDLLVRAGPEAAQTP